MTPNDTHIKHNGDTLRHATPRQFACGPKAHANLTGTPQGQVLTTPGPPHAGGDNPPTPPGAEETLAML
jgi:hypothetical protein